jgi:hypothetical protein
VSPTTPFAIRLCPHCRAENPLDNQSCWLCHAPLAGAPEVVLAELAKKPSADPLTKNFQTLLLAGCGLVVLLVGLGLVKDDPGLLALYAIVVIPALIATGVHWLIAASRGKQASALGMFSTFIVSGFVTAAIVVVVIAAMIIAAVIALLQFCADMLHPHG